jgi:hypothetical protein
MRLQGKVFPTHWAVGVAWLVSRMRKELARYGTEAELDVLVHLWMHVACHVAAVSQGCRKQIQNDKRLDGSQRLYSTMEYAPLNAGNVRNLLGKVILTKRIFANIDENER